MRQLSLRQSSISRPSYTTARVNEVVALLPTGTVKVTR